MSSSPDLVVGRLYKRTVLHDRYGGQRQGGIATSKTCPAIFLFTGQSGEQHGYGDRWLDGSSFLYYGEGQTGDMRFVRGNKAVRDHVQDGRPLALFEKEQDGWVRFLGFFECVAWEYCEAPDSDGRARRAIRFRLQRV